jgi:hypothetical protein
MYSSKNGWDAKAWKPKYVRIFCVFILSSNIYW